MLLVKYTECDSNSLGRALLYCPAVGGDAPEFPLQYFS
jgi:hypothetical protein